MGTWLSVGSLTFITRLQTQPTTSPSNHITKLAPGTAAIFHVICVNCCDLFPSESSVYTWILLILGFRLENLPLQYIYAMVFAVEEINHSAALLPGVKLGYHIRDSCALHPWTTQAALSLVAGDSASCDSATPADYSAETSEKKGTD